MQSVKSATIESVNKFIEDQQKVEEGATFQLIQFDDQYEPQDATDLKDAKLLDGTSYLPRGMTAYLDALGKTIANVRQRQVDAPSDKVIIVVMTDGLENASKEFKRADVKESIENMQNLFQWTFIFLGANMDAVTEAATMGIPMTTSISYAATAGGTASATSSTSNLVAQLRSTGTTEGYTNVMRNEALGKEAWSNLGDNNTSTQANVLTPEEFAKLVQNNANSGKP